MDSKQTISCQQAELFMTKHMDMIIAADEASKLLDHVQSCESCREQYLMFDQVMELAASPDVIVTAPDNFTAAVMAEVNKMPAYSPVAQVVEKANVAATTSGWEIATRIILWASPVLFAIILLAIHNPAIVQAVTEAHPIAESIVGAIVGFGLGFSNFITEATQNATLSVNNAFGVTALAFVLLLGSILVVLQRDEEKGTA